MVASADLLVVFILILKIRMESCLSQPDRPLWFYDLFAVWSPQLFKDGKNLRLHLLLWMGIPFFDVGFFGWTGPSKDCRCLERVFDDCEYAGELSPKISHRGGLMDS